MLVVNSRTPEETAALAFDIRAAVESRGMRYAELPIGGASGASPALTGELSGLLSASDGPVVLHCRSGTRSAHLYAAYLIDQDPTISTPFDTMNSQPQVLLNPRPETRNPKQGCGHSMSLIKGRSPLNPKPQTRHPVPGICAP